jgi:hypothetical protein
VATQIEVNFNAISNALKISLDNWGKSSARYAPLYKTLPRDVLAIGHAGLEEMTPVKPGGWEVWWAKNHNRFIRASGVKQRDLILLHEIMYHFLTAFSRGQLNNDRNVDDDRTQAASTFKNKTKTKSR